MNILAEDSKRQNPYERETHLHLQLDMALNDITAAN
jgi:hypothetical protein